MKYRLVRIPGNKTNDPCLSCCFGNDEGECHASLEILKKANGCGSVESGFAYVYREIKE